MAILLADNDKFISPNKATKIKGYKPVAVGKPLAISLLSFHPGNIKKDWGGKAELMITSQIRVGPKNEPAPKFINMMLKNYNYKKANIVQDYGGDLFGDPMMYYTKSYLGQKVGLTMHGTELDKIAEKSFNKIRETISSVGRLAFFTPAAPYLAAAGLASNIAKTFLKIFNRNDRLTLGRKDFYFNSTNRTKLQAGRYLLWNEGPSRKIIKNNYFLSGENHDHDPNILVERSSNKAYRSSSYFVIQIDGKERKEYNDFEIGAGSAQLLEKYGNKESGSMILQSIKEIAAQVNDAKQLSTISKMFNKYKSSTGDAKEELKTQIEAQYKLFTDTNTDFIKALLDKQIK